MSFVYHMNDDAPEVNGLTPPMLPLKAVKAASGSRYVLCARHVDKLIIAVVCKHTVHEKEVVGFN